MHKQSGRDEKWTPYQALLRGAALMCVPRLKMGVYTDWEAMSTPSADDFERTVYW